MVRRGVRVSHVAVRVRHTALRVVAVDVVKESYRCGQAHAQK